MFIVLEGIDGSGKTSVNRALSERLRNEGLSVATISEPTELIRPLLSEMTGIKDPLALFLFFMADRMHHQSEIGKLLETNDIVICDRYLLSSFAYQGTLISDLNGSWDSTVKWMSHVAEHISHMPDLTLFLDVEPRLSVKRIREKRGKPDPYFEDEEYLSRVRDAYLKLLNSRSVIIDSTRELPPVEEDAYRAVKEFLGKKQ